MKDFQLWALQNAGGSTSVNPVQMSDEGQLKVDAEITATVTATVESSGDELNADTLRVHQVGNAGVSVNVIQYNGVATAQGDEKAAGTLRIVHVGDVGVSTSADLAKIAGVTAVNGDELGAGHLRVYHVANAGVSAQAKVLARTTNPTAASDATSTFAGADDLGRTLTRPIQVRDLIITAYATITDSSEDTFLAGAASTFHDLIYVMGANNSDAAVSVDFRSTTGGPVVCTLAIPANSTAGVSLPVPIPSATVADTWTAQNSGSDISNTTVKLSGLFSKEI